MSGLIKRERQARALKVLETIRAFQTAHAEAATCFAEQPATPEACAGLSRDELIERLVDVVALANLLAGYAGKLIEKQVEEHERQVIQSNVIADEDEPATQH